MTEERSGEIYKAVKALCFKQHCLGLELSITLGKFLLCFDDNEIIEFLPDIKPEEVDEFINRQEDGYESET